MSPSEVTGAVLFDVDGTLVDTNYLHVFAWVGAFHALGSEVDAVAVHRAVGMGAPQLLERLLGADAERLGGRATEEHANRYRETLPLMRRFAGAAELLRAVAAHSKVVLATSAQPEELSALRRVLDADDALTAITSSEDVDRAKPATDLIEVALGKAAVGPDRAIFVGDTVWDVIAARAAKVPCVAVLSGGIGRSELEDAGAIAVYSDVAHLLNNLSTSPLASVLTD